MCTQGKRYEADLLSDGMIFWNDEKYSSPYAWASQCKNLVNPDHKTGIGWGHVSSATADTSTVLNHLQHVVKSCLVGLTHMNTYTQTHTTHT